jgi:hypothetical protein
LFLFAQHDGMKAEEEGAHLFFFVLLGLKTEEGALVYVGLRTKKIAGLPAAALSSTWDCAPKK